MLWPLCPMGESRPRMRKSREENTAERSADELSRATGVSQWRRRLSRAVPVRGCWKQNLSQGQTGQFKFTVHILNHIREGHFLIFSHLLSSFIRRITIFIRRKSFLINNYVKCKQIKPSN